MQKLTFTFILKSYNIRLIFHIKKGQENTLGLSLCLKEELI